MSSGEGPIGVGGLGEASPAARGWRRWRSPFLVAAGLVCLVLAAAGAILPLLPTTPLVLVAAACFARSSPRLDAWLLRHRVFGPLIREWRTHGAIPRRVKWIATGAIVVVGGSSVAFAVPIPWVRLFVSATLIAVVVWIWTFPDGPAAEVGTAEGREA